MNVITKADLLADSAGSRFTDILKKGSVHGDQVEGWIDFLNGGDRSKRLLIAARDHKTAALKGVLAEAECLPWVTAYFDKRSLRETLRVKMCLGVLVRIHLASFGWEPEGKKAHLGKRAPGREEVVNGKTVILKPKHNGSGFSDYFTMAECYKPRGELKGWKDRPDHWHSDDASEIDQGG